MRLWHARSGISEAGKLPSGLEMPLWGPLQSLISEAPGAELDGDCVFSWHQIPANGNVVLFHTVGFAMNSRTLFWLRYKNGCFCGIPGALEIKVQKCGKVTPIICQEPWSMTMPYSFSHQETNAYFTATTTPSHHQGHFFHYSKWSRVLAA